MSTLLTTSILEVVSNIYETLSVSVIYYIGSFRSLGDVLFFWGWFVSVVADDSTAVEWIFFIMVLVYIYADELYH